MSSSPTSSRPSPTPTPDLPPPHAPPTPLLCGRCRRGTLRGRARCERPLGAPEPAFVAPAGAGTPILHTLHAATPRLPPCRAPCAPNPSCTASAPQPLHPVSHASESRGGGQGEGKGAGVLGLHARPMRQRQSEQRGHGARLADRGRLLLPIAIAECTPGLCRLHSLASQGRRPFSGTAPGWGRAHRASAVRRPQRGLLIRARGPNRAGRPCPRRGRFRPHRNTRPPPLPDARPNAPRRIGTNARRA
jgi:hypothetical protein